MSVARAMATALLAAAAFGCVTKHAGVRTAEQEPEWQVGLTTRRDVVAKWGNPDQMKGDTWTWKDWNLIGGKFRLGYMGVGFTVSNARVSTRQYRLTFDRQGKLVSQVTVDSVPGGAEWSMNPWN